MGLTSAAVLFNNPCMVPSLKQVKVRIAELGLRTAEVAANVGVSLREFDAILNLRSDSPLGFVSRCNRYLDQREKELRKDERARFRGPWVEDWER